MHIYGNWKRINYWASRTHYNEWHNYKANDGCYKYLGQDENISYVGPINKDRVTKMHTKRMKKIWTSELSAYNKNIAYNAFAVYQRLVFPIGPYKGLSILTHEPEKYFVWLGTFTEILISIGYIYKESVVAKV